MDEILYELRDHMAGLNCGRWDYIFSFIKRLKAQPDALTPDRAVMTMGQAFLQAYSLKLIQTCHRRGAFAMGGMAAQIPVKGDEAANQAAFAKVKADKEREAGNGHDGTWVAHPDLVPVAMEVFDRMMPGPNQLSKLRGDVVVTREDMLRVHEGERTENGLRENIRVGVQYIEAWLRGRGAVPLYNLMEDAATAEISRTQIWQWLYHAAPLDDGRKVTRELFETVFEDELSKLPPSAHPAERGSAEYGICSTAFLEHAFRTDAYELTVTFNEDGSWSYVSDTTLVVRGQGPFRHLDRNTLVKVAEPTPNPLYLRLNPSPGLGMRG
jgi:malate synthase